MKMTKILAIAAALTLSTTASAWWGGGPWNGNGLGNGWGNGFGNGDGSFDFSMSGRTNANMAGAGPTRLFRGCALPPGTAACARFWRWKPCSATPRAAA